METATPTNMYQAKSDRMWPAKKAATPGTPRDRATTRYPSPIVAHQNDQYGFDRDTTMPSATERAAPPASARPRSAPPDAAVAARGALSVGTSRAIPTAM